MNDLGRRAFLGAAAAGSLTVAAPGNRPNILLILLGRLAKTSGGIGLRSAIKVVQEVLIETGNQPGSALADAPVGRLANAVVFYGCLRRDIERSFPHAVDGVEKAINAFGEDSTEARLAKTVAVMQAIDDFPLSIENVAALMHEAVDAEPLLEKARESAKRLMDERLVHLAEVDGRLRFMSPIVDDLEKKRRAIAVGTLDLRMVYVEVLRDLFTPKPSAHTDAGKSVACGVKILDGVSWFPVQDESEEIQLHLALHDPSIHEAELGQYTDRSRLPEHKRSIFLLAPFDAEVEVCAVDVVRCRRIYDTERTRAIEKEVSDYLNGQHQKAERRCDELIGLLKAALLRGSFVFRGIKSAVSAVNAELAAAAREELKCAGMQGSPRSALAAAPADAAEGFLQAGNLAGVPTKIDPLGLVDRGGGTIKTAHAAIADLRDYLQLHGAVDGRKLVDEFASSPYGWSKETTRYVVAAMLVAGLVKLRANGTDITVPGPTAVEQFKNTAAFNRVGVSLRNTPPDPELMIRTAERLLELTGKNVMPIERDIARLVTESFPDLQRENR